MKQQQPRIVTRGAYVRAMTPEQIENRQVEFVISSEAVDSYNTVFRISGWDLSNYLRNSIVCYQHRAGSSDPDDIIGTSTVRIEGDLLIGTVTFEEEAINPKAEKIFRKVQAGTLKMASVGANVQQARYGDSEKGEDKDILYFTKQRLMEWSIVSVGSNPDAHKRNADAMTELRAEISKEIPVDATGVKESRSVQEAQLMLNKNKK